MSAQFGKTFFRERNPLLTTEMVERTKSSADAGDFFTSQTNFDLEEEGAEKKKKRVRRQRGGRPRSKPISLDNLSPGAQAPRSTPLDHAEIPVQPNEITTCPGCGNDVEEGDFVDTIVSFVTGAVDYLAGDPVRTQAVQSLKQQAKALDLPEPYEDWLLEICVRLETQVQRQIDSQQASIRDSLIDELRREVIGELYEHIRAEIEASIRQEVEREMWEEFQQMYREGNSNVG